MEILSQDNKISNDLPTQDTAADLSSSMPTPPPPAKKVRKLSRKKMIADIQNFKNNLGQSKNFKKGSAFNLTNLFIQLANLNYTLLNIKSLSDEEVYAIWQDIIPNK